MSVLAFGTGCVANNVLEKPAESTVNQSESKDEQIKPYGQLVDVKGKKMNVLVTGEGGRDDCLDARLWRYCTWFKLYENARRIIS